MVKKSTLLLKYLIQSWIVGTNGVRSVTSYAGPVMKELMKSSLGLLPMNFTLTNLYQRSISVIRTNLVLSFYNFIQKFQFPITLLFLSSVLLVLVRVFRPIYTM